MSPRFLSFISVLSQIQLRELGYTYVQYIKIGGWQLLPQEYRETERRNLPFSGSNSSHLSLIVWQELFAKGLDSTFATPIAWLIDEQGIIMADVAVGGDAILALTKERGQVMREHMQTRLEMLRKELEKGQVEFQKVESQRTYLHETILRISGAIQVLEELLAEEQSAQQNGMASADKAQLATSHSSGIDSRRT